jgi:hypothetical protein
VECEAVLLYQDSLHYDAMARPFDGADLGHAVFAGCGLGCLASPVKPLPRGRRYKVKGPSIKVV